MNSIINSTHTNEYIPMNDGDAKTAQDVLDRIV